MNGSIDRIAGEPHDRDASQAAFTGGMGGMGLGGKAEPEAASKDPVP